jgi:hypothetical protein
MKERKSIYHTEGPFAELRPGDIVQVLYKDEPVAIIQISRVKQHALEGNDADFKCKVTIVTPKELRFYGSDNPIRQIVLRGVCLVKVEKN